jgi:hypothetical protein
VSTIHSADSVVNARRIFGQDAVLNISGNP